MQKLGNVGLNCFDLEYQNIKNNPEPHYVLMNNEVEVKPICQNCQHFNRHKSNDLGVCCRRTANLMLKCKPEYLNESIRYTMCIDTCDNWERRI